MNRCLGVSVKVVLAVLGGGFLCAHISNAQSMCSRPDDGGEILRAVVAQGGSSLTARSGLLATPVPALFQDTISLETNGNPRPGDRITPICFYSVTVPAYQLDGNAIESVSVQLDDQREWIAAINLKSHSVYLLAGSRDPVAGFNGLMRDLHLHVTDSDAADAVFDSYLAMARGDHFRQHVVTDEMKLESLALEDFRLRSPQSESRQAFERWWNATSNGARRWVVPPQTLSVHDGYIVRYFVYDRGSVRRQDIHVQSDGTVREESESPNTPSDEH